MPSADLANRRPALISAVLSAFFTPFMASSVNIALPSIGREFAMNAVELGWVATSYLLATAVFLLPFGRLADIYGRKRIFKWGAALFGLASLCVGLVNSGLLLILLRVGQGIASAMMFSTSMAIVVSVYPPKEKGRAIGMVTAAAYLGLSFGPFGGGLLTQHLGWRSLFLVTVPFALLLFLNTLLKLKGEWAEARGERFDVSGALIYGASLVGVMYGFSLLPDWSGALLVAAGVAGAFAFYFYEAWPEHPLLNVRALRGNVPFIYSNIAALINYSATFAVSFLLSLYLQYLKALSPQQAGFILVTQPAMMAVFSPMAGRLSDRIEPRRVVSAGMAMTAVGLTVFAFLTSATPMPLIVADLALIGLGFALFSSPNTNAIMASVERRFYGIAAAMQSTMRLVGQMLSMGFVMLVFAVVIGRVQITPEYFQPFLHATRIAFAASAALCFVGIYFSLARGKMHEG